MENTDNLASQFLMICMIYCFINVSSSCIYYYQNGKNNITILNNLNERVSNFIANFVDNIFFTYNNFFINNVEVVNQKKEEKTILEIKYEDKYLDKIRKIPNIYLLTEQEEKMLLDKTEEFSLKKTDETNETNENTANKQAYDYVINQRLDKLNKNFIIEYTPLGNVIMTYNNKKEVFDYYSDNIIPYRFLETVLRKYVITNNCRPLYIDMEDELKQCDDKLKLIDENNAAQPVIENVEKKKNVFAKFKSYNKEGQSGRVNTVPPPQNGVSNKGIDDKNADRKILLKERANRYSYQGKINNFSILPKIDKKAISKKYALTFSEFKNMIL